MAPYFNGEPTFRKRTVCLPHATRRLSHYDSPCWAAALVAVALASPSAFGYTATTNLGRLGLTENNQRTGDAVQTVCGQLAPRTDRNAQEEDLFVNCRKMVQTGNDISGSGPTGESLGLNQAELSEVVQTVASEELSATRDITVELATSQTNVVLTRLQALRSGVRFGLTGTDAFNDAIAFTDPRQQAEWTATGGGAGDGLTGPWGFFANGAYGWGDREGTDFENEFDYDVWGMDMGVDYRFSDNLIVGALFSFSTVDADFDEIPAVPDSDVESDNWGGGIYGTYYHDRYYIDGLLGYTYSDYDMRRGISPTLTDGPRRTAKSDTDSDTFTASIGGGLDFTRNQWTFGPYGRLTYQDTEIDGYNESGAFGLNLTVDDQDWESLTLVLGGRASYALSRDWGVIVPQGRLGWVHEFEDDSEEISAIYSADPQNNTLIAVTDEPDENYLEFGLGFSAVLRSGLQAFVDYQTLFEHKFLDDHLITVGLRGEL